METQERLEWNLYRRFMRLPADQIGLIENLVVNSCKCHRRTFVRVLKGESENLKVMLSLANVLNCTLDDLMNPNYVLQDPHLDEEFSNKVTTAA